MKNKLAQIELQHDNYISLHVQLHNSLRQLIISGQWAHGERIPSEPKLAKHLGISRSTVRIALQSAEIEGLITRMAGRGTFVSYKREEKVDTRFVGYVTRNFHNNLHRTLLSTVETELRSAGVRVIFSTASDSDEEAVVLQQLLDENIAGLVLWPNANPSQHQQALLHRYQDAGIPIVFVDRLVHGIEADYVASDNYGGTYHLVKHLIELGHQRIVYLRSNIRDLKPVEDRQRGYMAAIQEYNLPQLDVLWLNSPRQHAFFETDIHHLLDACSPSLIEQVIALLQPMQPLPTAIACVNDALAIITIRAIQQMGLRVPEDISVVGFDDISLAAYTSVPLTTARQDAHELGEAAAQALLDRMDGFDIPARHITLPTSLQIRSSTATPTAIKKPSQQDERRIR